MSFIQSQTLTFTKQKLIESPGILTDLIYYFPTEAHQNTIHSVGHKGDIYRRFN